MNIAICDDDISCVDRVLQLLENYRATEKLVISTYFSGKDFLSKEQEAMRQDIIFLDIEMSEVSGIDVAMRLREEGSKAIIIFITGYVNYVSDTFRLGAFQFLLKPVKKEDFALDFERAVKTYKEARCSYYIKWRNNEAVVEYGDICFIEGYNRHLRVVLSDDNVYECVGKLSEEEVKLRDFHFGRCHQGYLVNIGKIKEINKNELILKNDMKIPISRQYTKKIIEQFHLFLVGEVI